MNLQQTKNYAQKQLDVHQPIDKEIDDISFYLQKVMEQKGLELNISYQKPDKTYTSRF